MAIEIKQVTTRRELKRFIRLNYEMYKDNAFAVPDLYEDMLKTFSRDKNPAFEFCEADYFLAYKEGRLVGRVAAIINRRANATWQKQTVRFGWIDFVDDEDGAMDADHVLNHSNWITITPNNIDRTDFAELRRLKLLEGSSL